MSDLLLPKILILDPDRDFLDQMKVHADKRETQIELRVFDRSDVVNLEKIVWEVMPDIIVVNLDAEAELEFANCIQVIQRLPMSPPPCCQQPSPCRCGDYFTDRLFCTRGRCFHRESEDLSCLNRLHRGPATHQEQRGRSCVKIVVDSCAQLCTQAPLFVKSCRYGSFYSQPTTTRRGP